MRSARTIGVALGMLLLVLVGAPAQAAPPTSTMASSALAPSPGISPAAEFVTHVGRYDFAGYNCPSGRACLAVWDVNTSSWKVFHLYRCGTYRLSYWNDEGALKNNQTGGYAVLTYGSNGGQLGAYPARGNALQEVDWTPVWTVRPC